MDVDSKSSQPDKQKDKDWRLKATLSMAVGDMDVSYSILKIWFAILTHEKQASLLQTGDGQATHRQIHGHSEREVMTLLYRRGTIHPLLCRSGKNPNFERHTLPVPCVFLQYWIDRTVDPSEPNRPHQYAAAHLYNHNCKS